MAKKIIVALAVALAALLAGLPLLLKAIASIAALFSPEGFSIPSADAAIVNLVFLFASAAGLLASADGKQLSLGTDQGVLSRRFSRAINPIRTGISVAVTTALFLSSFSELFMAFAPGDRVWGIPLPAVFAAMPLMYAGMLALRVSRRESVGALALGFFAGLAIASGPLCGVIYSLLKIESVPALSAIFDAWVSLAGIALWPLIALLIFSALIGVPIFIVLSGIAYVAFSQGGGYVEMIPLETYSILTDKSVAAIPLFTVAGYLLAHGSAGRRLVAIVKESVGWIRGGAVIASVLVATCFTTFTGASGVTILALGGLLTVILTGNGYDQEDAESLVTATGSIGMLFPPSLAIIMYGTSNIFSVDVYDLFKGALIPGVVMAISMIALGIVKDKEGKRLPFSGANFLAALRGGVAEIFLPIALAIGYFSGFFSLIETAAFAACYAFILEVFVRKDFAIRASARVVAKAIPIAGGVLVIIGAAKGLAYFLVDAGVPMALTDLVASVVHSKYLFLFLLNILLLIVGCLMDLYSAILVVSPLVIPVAESFGISPVHTGVIFLTNLSLGFLTPPVGMNLFIASYTFERPVARVVRNILPWLAVQFAALLFVTYVPWFSEALL